MQISCALIGFKTMLHRECDRFLRIWMQTLLPPAVTMVLYFVIFGKLVGAQVADIQHVTYMQYLAPGLIMMAVINNAYANVVSSLYGMRFNHSIEEIIISPLSRALMLIGFVAGGVLRGLCVGAIVTVIALFFTHLTVQHVLWTFCMVLLTATLFSLAGFLNGIFARNFDDISVIPTFVLTPLTYLGGVFYSVDALKGIWHSISLANPILYMVSCFRYGVLGIADVNVYAGASMITVLTIGLFFTCLALLNRGVGLRS